MTQRRRLALWLLAVALAAAALAVSLARLPNPPQWWPTPDLGVYSEGVRLLLEGQNPYGLPLGFGGLPYTYPPFSLLVFAPLAYFSPSLFVVATVNTLALAVAIWAVLRSAAPAPVPVLGIDAPHAAMGAGLLLAAQSMQPVAANITFGQVNVVLMMLILVDLLLVPTRFRGVLTGIAAMIKLIPLIFIVYLVWARQRRPTVTFLTTCLVCIVLPILLIPAVSRDYYSRWLFNPDQPGRTYPVPFTNQSLHAVAMRVFGGPGAEVEFAWAILALLVFGLLLLSLSGLRRSDSGLAVCYVGLAGLLISPVSWSHHWVWIVPLVAAALCSARRFPLLLVPLMGTVTVMIGSPWFLQMGATLPTDPPLTKVLWAHGYLVGGLLILMTAAAYGIRGRRRAHLLADTEVAVA